MEKVSMSHEDYLEAVVALGGTDVQPVRSVDIAAHLEVSKASVSRALGVLREKNLVVPAHYGHVLLTREGYAYGCAVLERHELLTRFLSKGMGIDEDEAEREACLIEHAISDEAYKKWEAFIKALDL